MGHFLLLEKTCLIIGLAWYYVDMRVFCFRVFFSKHFLSALSPAQMKIVWHIIDKHIFEGRCKICQMAMSCSRPQVKQEESLGKGEKNASSFFYLFFKRQNTVVLCLFLVTTQHTCSIVFALSILTSLHDKFLNAQQTTPFLVFCDSFWEK